MPPILRRSRRLLGAALLLFLTAMLAAVGPAHAQKDKPSPKDKPTPKDKSAEKKSAAYPTGDGVLAVFDSLDDVLRAIPGGYVLTPEKYKSLLDELAKLRREAEKPRLRTPSRLTLKGKIETNAAVLTAVFDFETDQPGQSVRLGCAQGRASGVSLDGRTPALKLAADGFSAEVDKPGEHALSLDLVVPLSTVPPGQGFTLDLPRAAITKLELVLPPNSREVRLGNKPADPADRKGDALAVALGAADKLELSWKPAAAAAAGAVFEAEGKIRVEADGSALTTRAALELRVKGGQVKEWRVVVPAKAQLELAPADRDRTLPVEAIDRGKHSERVIRMKEPTGDPLAVTISHTQSAPKVGSGKPVSVGPFAVLGAAKQTGSVLVVNNADDRHLELSPRGDLDRADPSEEDRRREPNLVAAFRYGPGPAATANAPEGGWLDVEAEAVGGRLQVRPACSIDFDASGASPRWRVVTTLAVTPHARSSGGVFRVQLPAGVEFVEEGSRPLPDRVRGVSYNPSTRVVEFRLEPAAATAQAAPFAVTVETSQAVEGEMTQAGRQNVLLPRPLLAAEQDAPVTILAPDDTELLAPDAGTLAGLRTETQSPHRVVYRAVRRLPAMVEIAWKPYRPPVVASSLADVTLTPAEVRVRQEIRYQLAADRDGERATLVLEVPAAALASWKLAPGAAKVISATKTTAGGSLVTLAPADPKSPTLVADFRYPPPIPAEGVLALPLLVPRQTTGGDSKVRVWAESGSLPTPGKGWAEQNVETVPGRNRLPALVVRAESADAPLTLRPAGDEAESSALIDRILARAELSAAAHVYQVGYRLRRVGTRRLDLELPAPAKAVNLRVTLDGRRIDYDVERDEGLGRRVRLRVAPELVGPGSVLEVSYQLDPTRLGGSALSTPLLPPKLLGESPGTPTRWWVSAPAVSVVLGPDPGPGVRTSWARRGWFIAPRQDVAPGELERWFAGTDPPADQVAGPPTAVFAADGLEPARLVHVPQQAWLVLCSLAVVLWGLTLSRLLLGRDDKGNLPLRSRALAVALVALPAVAAFAYPRLAAAAAYGVQPGVAVLAALVAIQWAMHERYRRRVVFLSSFARPRGSSLSRREADPVAPAPPLPQPSTVDQPRPVGSSMNRPV